MQADEARELAEWLHEKLCCAQDLPWEEGDICDDCLDSVKEKVLPLLARHALEARKAAFEEASQVAEVTWLNSFGPINEKIKRVFDAIRSLAERASRGAGGNERAGIR